MKRWTTKRAENFTYKVTDANGNSTTGTITVNIVDDVPTAITPQTSMLANGAGLAVTGKLLDIDGNIDNNYGADLSGAKVQFAPSLTGTDSGFTSGGLHIMYTVSADGKTLTGATSAGTVYAITLSPDGSLGTANDTYSVQMFGLVDGGGSKIIFNAGGYQFAGGNDPWAVFRTAADDDSRDLLFTPIAPVGDQTVNSSNTSGGIGSGQSVGAGEGLRLDFVVDAQGDPAKNNTNSDYGIAANQDHTWDSHYTTNGALAVISSTNGSTIRIKAFDDDFNINSTNSVVGDGQQDSLTAVALGHGGETKIVSVTGGLTQTVTVGTGAVGSLDSPRTYTVTFVNVSPNATPIYEAEVQGVYGVNITSGISASTSVGAYTQNGYNASNFDMSLETSSRSATSAVPQLNREYRSTLQCRCNSSMAMATSPARRSAPSSSQRALEGSTTSRLVVSE